MSILEYKLMQHTLSLSSTKSFVQPPATSPLYALCVRAWRFMVLINRHIRALEGAYKWVISTVRIGS